MGAGPLKLHTQRVIEIVYSVLIHIRLHRAMTDKSSLFGETLLVPAIVPQRWHSLAGSTNRIGWIVAFRAKELDSVPDEETRHKHAAKWRAAAHSWRNRSRTGDDMFNELVSLSSGATTHVLAEMMKSGPSSGKGKEAASTYDHQDDDILSHIAAAAARDQGLAGNCVSGESLRVCKPKELEDILAKAEKDGSRQLIVVTPASEETLSASIEAGDEASDDPLAEWGPPPEVNWPRRR